MRVLKKLLQAVSLILLASLCLTGVFAQEPVEVSISVASRGASCTVGLFDAEGKTLYDQITLKIGETGEFKLSYDKVGQEFFTIRVLDTDTEAILFDHTVYHVEVFIENGEGDKLVPVLIIQRAGSDVKLTDVELIHREPPVEPEPPGPEPPGPEPPEPEPPQTEPETEPAQEDEGEPTVAINGTDYLGYLTFPGYGKELPVVAEWDFEKLNDAPVRYSGTAAGDDLVISGHNFRVHFGFFGNMKKGDRVTFTDARGSVISYRVGLIEVLRATDIAKMTAGEWDLTLFTCDYDGQARIAVRCDRDNTDG
ncbi:MAG: sortase [Clostridia bacterium]|nr:sortase [Clostridia bacterium]